MLVLILAHLVAALAAPWLVRAMGSRAFIPLSVPSLATVVYLVRQAATVHAGATDHPHHGVGHGSAGLPPAVTESWTWVPQLGMDLDFRLDGLSWLLAMVVAGVGTLVLLYCTGYFSDDEEGLGLFAGSLTAFAGAMLGLVTTDNMLVLYVFWELTSILSFLLIGHRITSRHSRSAAMEALVITAGGGLAMLVGIIGLGAATGSYSISNLLAHPPQADALVTTSVVLLLVGAFTKSAQVPFHFWLPGAMAAPTPVSAYLHAAAMVKAGIYLVARFAPAFAHLEVWQWAVLLLGGPTMLVGAYRSLRQVDIKLVLAYGTVSQLGFLVLVVGHGTQDAARAGLVLLLAHALFKGSLFLVVGAIDHCTGTRDLRRLSGLSRSMPLLFATACVSAASMAGLPPLLGFVSKEGAYTALDPTVHGWATREGVAFLVVLVGSMMTFAYSARFLCGAFRTQRTKPATPVHAPGFFLQASPALLAVGTIVLGLASGPLLEPVVGNYASFWPASEHPLHLGLWHGWTVVLAFTLLTYAVGVVLHLRRRQVNGFQRGVAALGLPGAERGFQLTMRAVDRGALAVTGLFQRGSLPVTLGMIFVVAVAVPVGVLLMQDVPMPEHYRLMDSWAQLGVAVVTAAAGVLAALSTRRLRAVVLAGVTGYGSAALFMLYGAPDLALTQLMVESISIVVFILVLRRMAGQFPDTPRRVEKVLRVLIAVGVAGVLTLVALVSAASRAHVPASAGLLETAYTKGGGHNVVNVILVDTRGWDTMGEIAVVLVCATGVASLVFLREEVLETARVAASATRTRRTMHLEADTEGSRWLADAVNMKHTRRSAVLEVVTRLVFHSMVVWSLYVLLVGHDAPGGGFAGGLIATLALTVRYLAGEADELRAAAPVLSGTLMGAGLGLAVTTGVLGMVAGGEPLQSWVFNLDVPVLGHLHLVTPAFFDVGVYLVVVGMGVGLLTSLGAGVDQQIESERGEGHRDALSRHADDEFHRYGLRHTDRPVERPEVDA
ncbi:Na+/H+ antiporter subunit A [Kytococcus schroeteri]|uniref:Na+/H+ antiporter subunit A n=1 Tax=Kytococcus schroeteri TaxID=138300 RepID=UPI0035EA54E7